MTAPHNQSQTRISPQRWLLGALFGVVAAVLALVLGLAPVVLAGMAGALLVVAILGRQEPAFASGLLVALGAILVPLGARQLTMCGDLYLGCTPELWAMAIAACLSLVVGLGFGAVTVRARNR